jgi:hypothetical protein
MEVTRKLVIVRFTRDGALDKAGIIRATATRRRSTRAGARTASPPAEASGTAMQLAPDGSIVLLRIQGFGDGRYRATYRVTQPDGVWNAAENGTYTVQLNADQVEDVNGVAARARVMGTFRVRIRWLRGGRITCHPEVLRRIWPRAWSRADPSAYLRMTIHQN